MRADAAAEIADLGALGRVQVGRGCPFDDLLVASLHRAVTLIEMIDRAILVAEDLHLDVAGALDHLLEIALAIAEGGLRLAAAFQHLGGEFVGPGDRAHAAPATAPAGLQHQRIADGRCLACRVGHVVAQHLGRRDHRNARRHGDAPGTGLVAQRPHGFRLGADEGDAGCGAGLNEVGVFREQPITGVNRIRPAGPGHPDDFRNRQIGRDRPHALADAIGLVGLEAMQRKLVLFGIDGDGALAEFGRRAHDADGDLAAVGNQYLAKRRRLHNRQPRAFQIQLACTLAPWWSRTTSDFNRWPIGHARPRRPLQDHVMRRRESRVQPPRSGWRAPSAGCGSGRRG